MFARLLTVSLLAILIGCGKQPRPASSAAADGASASRKSDSTSAPEPAQLAAILTELTQAVRKYAAEQQRAPKGLDELVSAGYLSTLPPAPAGKRFAINKSLQVYVTD